MLSVRQKEVEQALQCGCFVCFVGSPPPAISPTDTSFLCGYMFAYIHKNELKKGIKIFSKMGRGGSRFSPNSSHTVKTSLSLPYPAKVGDPVTHSVCHLQATCFFLLFFCSSVLHFILFSASVCLSPTHPTPASSPVQSSPVQSSYLSEPRPAPTDSCPLCILAFIPAPTHNLSGFCFLHPKSPHFRKLTGCAS